MSSIYPTKLIFVEVIIRNRYSSAFQSGDNYAHQWQIMWKSSQKWINPLTGYVSGADPMGTVKLFFDTREAAIAFAERNGWKYQVERPATDDVTEAGWRRYQHNFLPLVVSSY